MRPLLGRAGLAVPARGAAERVAVPAARGPRPVAAVLLALLVLLLAAGAAAAGQDAVPAAPVAVPAGAVVEAATPVVQRSAADLVNRALVARTALLFTAVGVYLLAGLALLAHWAARRDDRRALAVALLSLVMAVHTTAVSGVPGYLLPWLFDPAAQARLEAGSYLLLNGLVAFVLWTCFPRAFRLLPPEPSAHGNGRGAAPRPLLPAWLARLNTAGVVFAGATSVAFTVAVSFAGPRAAGYVLSASRAVTVGLMVLAVAVVLQAVERRRPGAAGLALGFALVVVGSLHDVLFAGAPDGRPYLGTTTFMAFVLLQAFDVARRAAYAGPPGGAQEAARRVKELRAATIAAHAASLAKSQFLTSVSHELRTPLASMLGYAQLLEDELRDKLGPRQHEFFATIQSSGDRLLALVNDLLDLARIEAGRLDLRVEEVDLAQAVADVRQQLYPLAWEKGLTLDIRIDAPGARVRADAERLRQILLNLVSNAIKFTDEGHVTLHVYATTLRGRPALAVAVQDTGPGISPAFLPHLFDRFTREERVYAGAPPGTGIGLTISRELAHRMGGEIDVESRVDGGSTFTLVLPAA